MQKNEKRALGGVYDFPLLFQDLTYTPPGPAKKALGGVYGFSVFLQRLTYTPPGRAKSNFPCFS